MMRRRLALAVMMIAAFGLARAHAAETPVFWTASMEPARITPGAAGIIRLEASIDPAWHIYSLTQPETGPLATTIDITQPAVLSASGAIRQSPFERKHDPVFNADVESFDRRAEFEIPVRVASSAKPGTYEAKVEVGWQACSARVCLMPASKTLAVSFTVVSSDQSAPAASEIRCPGATASLSAFYYDLAARQQKLRDDYQRRLKCIPALLESRNPEGDDLYFAAVLWLRHDEEHRELAKKFLTQYLHLPDHVLFEESALAKLTDIESRLGQFDAAIEHYHELAKKYRLRSTPEEQFPDETNVEYASWRLMSALSDARDYNRLEAIARESTKDIEQQHSESSWRLSSAESYLLEALDSKGDTQGAVEARKHLAALLDDHDKFLASADMWVAIRKVRRLEREDPAAALRVLEAAHDAYQRTGFERNYENDVRRLKLYSAPAPPLDSAAWVNSPPLSMDSLRGKVVLLDFWMSWCQPCREGFPELRKLTKERAGKGLVVIGVTENDGWVLTHDGTTIGRGADGKLSWDREVELLRQFAKDFDLQMPIAIGRRPDDPAHPYAAAPVLEKYGIGEFPTAVVIDRRGVIRFLGDPENPRFTVALNQALEEER